MASLQSCRFCGRQQLKQACTAFAQACRRLHLAVLAQKNDTCHHNGLTLCVHKREYHAYDMWAGTVK